MKIIGSDKLCTRFQIGTTKFLEMRVCPLQLWSSASDSTICYVFDSPEEKAGFLKKLSNNSGITILEIIVAGFIISVLMTSALMGWQKTIEFAEERRAVADLKLILSAQIVHAVKYNALVPPDRGASLRSIDEINAALKINIPAPKNIEYQCHNINNIVSCDAIYRGGKWIVRANTYRNEYYCHIGNCPACLPGALGGCP